MKNLVLLLGFLMVGSPLCFGQVWKDLKKQAEEKLNTSAKGDGLNQDEIAKGLKNALEVGAEQAVSSASKVGGFNNNQLIRIPFPPEAQKAKEFALKAGLDSQVEQFESTMNKAAEQAASEATVILKDAILSMSVKDARSILNGEEDAATQYLKRTTTQQLTQKFRPIIDRSINEVNLTKYWNPLATAYNKNPFSRDKVDPDLNAYVTERALEGLFKLIAQEEKDIRENPAARVNDLLKRVFGG